MNPDPPVKYRPLSVGDCAILLSMSPGAVKKLMQRGLLDPTWTTGNRHLVAYGELTRWARFHRRTLLPLEVLGDDLPVDHIR